MCESSVCTHHEHKVGSATMVANATPRECEVFTYATPGVAPWRGVANLKYAKGAPFQGIPPFDDVFSKHPIIFLPYEVSFCTLINDTNMLSLYWNIGQSIL